MTRRRDVCVMLLAFAACRSAPATARRADGFTVPPSVADSIHTERIAPRIHLHHLVRLNGPQRAHVLDLDLRACVTVRAAKGGPTAVGRLTTSAILQARPAADSALAAVNADFFLFNPAGVPVGALVEDGAVITGPIDRPVLAFDRTSRPFIGRVTLTANLTTKRGELIAATWNRPQRGTAGVVGSRWGQPPDSLMRSSARMLVPLDSLSSGTAPAYRVVTLVETHPGIAAGDTLLIVNTEERVLATGDTVALRRSWSPIVPQQAVGGFPLLLVDSAITSSIDIDGAIGFRGPNLRTAAGVALGGRRLLLMVIDGRRPGYSAGVTTRETAEWLQAFGAVDAINLDGGGSTTMVVRKTPSRPDSAGAARFEIVNRPSDAAGERPVANALVISQSCRESLTRP